VLKKALDTPNIVRDDRITPIPVLLAQPYMYWSTDAAFTNRVLSVRRLDDKRSRTFSHDEKSNNAVRAGDRAASPSVGNARFRIEKEGCD
jgi:hypothetical protein